jgi:hypothetical protein
MKKLGNMEKANLKILFSLLFSFKLVFISKINAMFTWALKPNKMPKHRLDEEMLTHSLLKTSDGKHNLMKKWENVGKSKFKKYCKIQSLWPILISEHPGI